MKVNMSDVMAVDWGVSYKWDVRFSDAPPPFNNWFPAYGYDETIISIQSKDFTIGNRNVKIPIGMDNKEIKLEFYDDSNGTLQKWLRAWANTIVKKPGTGVASLAQSVKQLEYCDKDSTDREINKRYLYVYPEGPVSMSRNAGENITVNSFSVTFVIAGEKG